MATKLQKARQSAGLSQSQLVSAVPDLKLKTLQSYEQGAVSINRAAAEVVAQIAKALDCKITDLLE